MSPAWCTLHLGRIDPVPVYPHRSPQQSTLVQNQPRHTAASTRRRPAGRTSAPNLSRLPQRTSRFFVVRCIPIESQARIFFLLLFRLPSWVCCVPRSFFLRGWFSHAWPNPKHTHPHSQPAGGKNEISRHNTEEAREEDEKKKRNTTLRRRCIQVQIQLPLMSFSETLIKTGLEARSPARWENYTTS